MTFMWICEPPKFFPHNEEFDDGVELLGSGNYGLLFRSVLRGARRFQVTHISYDIQSLLRYLEYVSVHTQAASNDIHRDPSHASRNSTAAPKFFAANVLGSLVQVGFVRMARRFDAKLFLIL